MKGSAITLREGDVLLVRQPTSTLTIYTPDQGEQVDEIEVTTHEVEQLLPTGLIEPCDCDPNCPHFYSTMGTSEDDIAQILKQGRLR